MGWTMQSLHVKLKCPVGHRGKGTGMNARYLVEGFVLVTALAAASPAAADSVKIPANYGEFTALYNRTLNQMRGALNHLREVAGGQ